MTIEIATVNAQEISYTTDGVDYFSNNDHRNLYLEQYCFTSHYKHGKTFQGQGDAMHQCKFCGSELPPNAHFCGICGQLQGEDTQSVTQITTLSEPVGTAPDTPPVFSNPSLPTVIAEPTGQQDADATISSSWSYLLPVPQNPPLPDERQTEESRALPLELILPLSAAELGQPPPGQLPMVHGTPQVGQVPTVHGTPSTPAGHPPGLAGAHNAVPSAPPHAGSAAQSWQPFSPAHQQPHHSPVYHPQPTGPLHPPQHPPAPPRHQEEPAHEHPTRHHRHEHKHEYVHHRTEPSKVQRPHRLRLRSSHGHTTHLTTASKVAVGTATKWLVVAIVAVVVAATGGSIFVLANAPGLSLSGSSAVSAGGTLRIHGKGFLPGGSVSLTLDNGLPIAYEQTSMVDHAGHEPAMSADVLFTLEHSASHASSNSSVPVGVTGSFDADVVAQTFWSPGPHTVHARENLGSRSANLQFIVLPSPAKLVVKPTSLTYKVQAGTRAIQALEISNAGQTSLNWTAATDGSNWLKLQGSSGNIGINGSGEFIDVTADASHLKVGTYTAAIHLNTNAGNAQVAVTLIVLSPTAKKQAQLNVNPTTLDFGQLMTNQQVTRPVSVGNLGSADLHWNAITGNASWLTLDTTSGTVQSGAIPQIIQASVNTGSLAPGSHSATLDISSNGGNAQVTITLAVIGTTPTPSPSPSSVPSPTLSPSPSSPSPTLPPPPPPPSPTPATATWSVNPTVMDQYDCSGGPTYTCTVTLTEDSGSNTNITWSAKDSTGGVSFSPPSTTLTPGASQQVSISNIPCQADTFTFTDNANLASPLNSMWTCTPPPPPSPTPSPTQSSTLKILGELTDWNGYCQSQGYASATLIGNTAYDWRCVDSSGQQIGISTPAACEWQYQDSKAEDLLANFYDPHGWECFTGAQNLGNATNWKGYCQSQGYASATLIGNTAYDWRCVDSSGQQIGVSVMNLCEWQYHMTPAVGRLIDFYDPNAWQCWG